MIGEPVGAELSPSGKASGGNESIGGSEKGYCKRGRRGQATRGGDDSREIFP